ncbi:hypothetical protein KR032_005447 [Drosophila birchii]|nr:hypothetical protein KR032_005447 [Drosophila birchii]
MSSQRGKPQRVNTGPVTGNNPLGQLKMVEEKRLIAPKRSYRPTFLKPSAIRRICHWPEECNSKTEATVMYFNKKFGKCSLSVCHEDLCPFTEVCKKHKPTRSIAMTRRISRIVKNSARILAIPKSKLKTQGEEKAQALDCHDTAYKSYYQENCQDLGNTQEQAHHCRRRASKKYTVD